MNFLKSMSLALVIAGAVVNSLYAQDAIHVTLNGNVGVGTDNPAYKFTIAGRDGVFGVDNAATFYAKNAVGISEAYFWPRWEDNMTYLNFGAGGFNIRNNSSALAMFITSDNKIGLGTDKPRYKFTIAGRDGVLGLDNDAIFVAKNSGGNYENFLWPRGGDNITYMNFGSGGFNLRNNSSGSALFITNDNKIGIGNTSPYGTFDVSGDIYTSIHGNSPNIHDASNRGTRRIGMFANDSNFAGMELETEVYSGGSGGIIKFMTWGYGASLTKEAVRINERGYVGIGTNSPSAVLEVRGYLAQGNLTDVRESDKTVSGLGRGFNNKPISIKAEYGILAESGFYTSSDRRIKKSLTIADTRQDLALLDQLKVTSYQYINNKFLGETYTKGLIAQEVEKVYPQAVNTQTDFIPSIFSVAEESKLNGDVLTIKLKSPHHLETGDRVRLIVAGNETKEETVTVLSPTDFTVDHWNGDPAKIFVFGKRVNDFKSVDYQQVFALGISGIQELSKQVAALQKENRELKEQNLKSVAMMAEIEKKIALIDMRISGDKTNDNKTTMVTEK